MRAGRGARLSFQPDGIMYIYMRKLLRDLPDMGVIALVAALFLPLPFNLASRVREDRAKADVNLDLVAKGLNQLLDPAVGNIGPDTQDI